MNSNRIYVNAAKMAALIVLGMLLCRVSRGAFTLAVAALGAFYALSNKAGPAVCCYVFLPLLIVINPALVPKSGSLWKYGLRFGPLLIGLCLVVGATRRRGNHRLPFGGILPFLGCAIVSSAYGYVPQISYLKLANYLVFLIGLWLGTQNIQRHPRDMKMIRTFFLAMIFLLVYGSFALIPFPGVSYATSVQAVASTEGAEIANLVAKELLADGGQALFCGITNHSQSLSPILALSMAWLLCDMLFVEKRFRTPHLVTIVAMLPMLYMTRSRVALLTGASAFALISVYTVNRIEIAPKLKRSIRKGLFAFLAFAAVVAVFSELGDKTITRWIRKTNDVENDQRTVSEAFTGSRQGLMQESLYDFRRNPLFGSGFQVAWYHEELWRKSSGLVLSASIEKGVLPVMVLGETGLVGSVAFVFFLLSFYITCGKRRLYVTATMFTLLLVSNMGEATFFSPGGMGGVLWILTVLGGFVIDTVLLFSPRPPTSASNGPSMRPLRCAMM